jgi:phage terminase large subunit-like protein
MMMRWYTNNVYVETDKKENKSFKKIEPKLRKTDGFFAFLHSLNGDEKLKVYRPLRIYDCHSY